MNKIPNYPKQDGDRNQYVRFAIMITADTIEKYKEIYEQDFETIELKGNKVTGIKPLQMGNFMCVHVDHDGYILLAAPAQFVLHAECLKACDMHNKIWWSDVQVKEIISASMKNSQAKKD